MVPDAETRGRDDAANHLRVSVSPDLRVDPVGLAMKNEKGGPSAKDGVCLMALRHAILWANVLTSNVAYPHPF
jgi:hypothetical protein